MKPISFKQQTTVLAENQDEYLSLPIHFDPTDPEGRATSCWQLSWKERLEILFFGKIWHSQLTFQHGFMPITMQTKMKWEVKN